MCPGICSCTTSPAETLEVTGPELGTMFSVKFGGIGVVASAQVLGFLKRIKNPDGTYYAFTAAEPSGTLVTLHTNPDNNGHSQTL